MKNNTNIEYMLLIRSALQFKQDLTEISSKLEHLSIEEIITVASYICSIREKIEYIENEFMDRLIEKR